MVVKNLLNFDAFLDWLIELLIDNEMKKPYTDTKISSSSWIREFDILSIESDDYVWHRDKNDRTVTVLEGEGWQFQLDNELPHIINMNDNIFIPKMVYHRIIPGKTKLRIKINEEL